MPAFRKSAGAGHSTYSNDYDRDVTAAACNWLQEAKERNGDKPWALFVSLVRPHFPLYRAA